MNAQPIDQDIQGSGRGNGRTGRGRGRGSAKNPTTRTVAAIAVKSKIGPSRLMEAEWVRDTVLKDSCFVIWLGSGSSGSQQWSVHHPVGETALSPGAWVMTPTRDLGFLLARRDSEELGAWRRRAELAKRQAVLTSHMGRRLSDQTEVWSFDGAPAIQPTIRTCMAAAKAAKAQESAWLDYADTAVQVAERSFKEALRTQAIPEEWFGENPKPSHITMGGPLGDQPQKAVEYLGTLSLNAAKDKVLRVLIGIDPTGHAGESSDEEDVDDEEEDPLANSGQPTKASQSSSKK